MGGLRPRGGRRASHRARPGRVIERAGATLGMTLGREGRSSCRASGDQPLAAVADEVGGVRPRRGRPASHRARPSGIIDGMKLAIPLLSRRRRFGQPQQRPRWRGSGNIERVTKSVNATWGIYIRCLETDEEIAIGADRQMDTMFAIRFPYGGDVPADRRGQVQLADRVKVAGGDKQPGTGVIRSLDDGVELTVKDLLTLMTIVSDNTATDLLYDKVGGPEAVTRLMKEWGLSSIAATGKADVWFKALRAARAPRRSTARRRRRSG